MDENHDRITGTVVWFNRILGRAEDANGEYYKLHIDEFQPEFRAAARTILRAGSEISFIAQPVKHRSEAKYRALDIAITKCDPLPDPTGLHIGYWTDLHGQRCSACGKHSGDKHAWCPACGAQMHDKDLYDILIRNLIHRDDRPDITILREDYTESQWSAICGIFGTVSETTKRIRITRPIVQAFA